LKGPITSCDKFKLADSAAIVAVRNNKPVGFIKYGYRKLYFYQKQGKVVECPNAPCILDFYVSTALQRSGIGNALFNRAMQVAVPLSALLQRYPDMPYLVGRSIQALQAEGPTCVAYDRPSPKLISFLAKHYSLRNGDLQPNRFMIFDGFI
jgi:alpha-tubulin N-acetyltransferase 1